MITEHLVAHEYGLDDAEDEYLDDPRGEVADGRDGVLPPLPPRLSAYQRSSVI